MGEAYPHEEIKLLDSLPVWFVPYEAADAYVTSHWHSSLEVICLEKGSMTVTVNDHTVALKEGQFLLINSRDIHSTLCKEPARVILLQIPYPFLKGAVPDYEFLRFEGDFNRGEGHDEARSLLLRMCGCYETYPHDSALFTLRFCSLLYEFLYGIVKNYGVRISSAVKVKTDRNLKRLELIMEFVADHYAEPVTLAQGAAAASLNPEYFCRFFKKYMGLTFLEYVNSVRLSHIYDELLQTDYTVTELLSRHGFTNYKLFMRMFRQTYGCTPSEKRRQCR